MRLLARNGTLLDTTTMEMVGERSVVIEDDRIVDVIDGDGGSAGRNIDADVTIDASGRYLLPGFIDAHVHHVIPTMNFARLQRMTDTELVLAMAKLAEATVSRGFTSVRDAAGAVGELVNAIERGLCPGPRITRAGRALSQTGGHGDLRPSNEVPIPSCGCQIDTNNLGHVTDGADACRKAARYELRDGSDFIKIMASGGVASPTDPFDSVQFTAEEIRAITTETDHRHTYTTAHAYLPDAIGHAIENGVRCIEHGNGVDQAVAERMAELGVIMVPTLVTYKAMQDEGAKFGMPTVNLDKNRGVFEMGQASIEIAKRAGVELGFGTDLLGEVQPWQNQEFAIRADLEPAADVLRSLYVTNAKLCRAEGLAGVLKPGAYADLLVSDVNPLERLSALAHPDAHIATIVHRGVVVRDLG
ncbi:MAG: amidohydrolase family protein [Actinomycetota bacterium]